MALISAAAIVWFRIPFQGSLAVLFLASLLFILAALGIGLLISSVSSTQQEAFMAAFLVMMPTVLLSGFMFPVHSMPEIFRHLTLLNPLRHYLEIVRAVFLKGIGISELARPFALLLVLGCGLFLFAAERFRRVSA